FMSPLPKEIIRTEALQAFLDFAPVPRPLAPEEREELMGEWDRSGFSADAVINAMGQTAKENGIDRNFMYRLARGQKNILGKQYRVLMGGLRELPDCEEHNLEVDTSMDRHASFE
ncbi:MAG: hypothetical protein ACRBCT_01125, partial [Alphaproteobacteria bacterium]